MDRRLQLIAAVALCVALALPAALASGSAPTARTASEAARGVDPSTANPLVGLRFFVDTEEPAWKQARYDARKHRSGRAALVFKIARQPRFRWFGAFTHNIRKAVRTQIARARSQGTVPLITTLRHQGIRCNSHYTAGGRREDRRTKKWFHTFARAIGSSRVVIAFEPDSLGTLTCLAKSRRKARLNVLRYGVSQLAKLPNATVYLEGAASDWVSARTIAKQLRYIGISKVRGFMLNVTHYDWTANNIRYGRRVSHLTGGKHFIISTAFNGRGPVHYRKRVHGHVRVINVHCHPLYRGLGPVPSTDTADPRVDAYMWIGRPGYSGGKCNGGPKRVGAWWPKRAYMFGRYATDWIRPPKHSRFGFTQHLTLHQVAGPDNVP